MSWAACMKLRRIANLVRMAAWVNLTITAVLGAFHAFDVVALLLPAGLWVACIMVIAYAAAWRIDRRAERIIGR
ncbi:MAG TPA: hypothetical protein VGP15_22590 [Burkholderiales bacterium]|jgi:hypothetical protein|nr:hypothetical protein [Burkholderiales bacterium]